MHRCTQCRRNHMYNDNSNNSAQEDYQVRYTVFWLMTATYVTRRNDMLSLGTRWLSCPGLWKNENGLVGRPFLCRKRRVVSAGFRGLQIYSLGVSGVGYKRKETTEKPRVGFRFRLHIGGQKTEPQRVGFGRQKTIRKNGRKTFCFSVFGPSH